jgi:AcrR family transcriptional regulator
VETAGEAAEEAVDASAAAPGSQVDERPVSTGRPMRADAVKNRQRILAAAEEVFAAGGVAAPIDEVAERAGVGIGTLYRHFPNKEALFEAIVVTRLEELADAASAPPGSGDPTDEFFDFLMLFADRVSHKHDLIDALGAAGIDIKSRCSEMSERLGSGVERMLQRAQAAGGVRDGVTSREVMGLVMGVCQVTEWSESAEPEDASGRLMVEASGPLMLEVVCDGLRAPGSRRGAEARRRSPAK